MRTLILGGDGMLGHQLMKYFSSRHDVRVTLRQDRRVYDSLGLFNEGNSYAGIDVRVMDNLLRVLADFQPEAMINAVGIFKQRSHGLDYISNLEINALLPHRLMELCQAARMRLVHISTDCVFSGRTGNYKETDVPDPLDVYGYSKLMGEVQAPNCITLRTSIIGKELYRKTGLFEWVVSQRNGSVKGYKNAIYSGFTTIEMCRVIEKIFTSATPAHGIFHVSSDPISKFDLLALINTKLGLNIKILPDYEFKCNLCLDSSRFRKDFNYTPPGWDAMLEELTQDYRERT